MDYEYDSNDFVEGTSTHPSNTRSEHVSLEEFTRDLNNALDCIQFQSQYQKVKVLILTWEDGLGVKEDVKVFKELVTSYGYEVRHEFIATRGTDRWLHDTTHQWAHECWRCQEEGKKCLGILYYNGHSMREQGDPEKEVWCE
jgi:hypothetical protein